MVRELKSLSIVMHSRKSSSRCLNKMLRPFADSTLFDLALEKLSKLVRVEKFICVYEQEFKDRLPCGSVQLLERSYESTQTDGSEVMYDHMKRLNSDYFMTFNPCFAHVQVSTLQSAIDFFLQSNYTTMTSVTKRHDWIYDHNGKVLVDGTGTGNTKLTPISYRVAHIFHCIDRERFVNEHVLWSNTEGDPHLFEVDEQEALDVDSEYDFQLSEALYLRLRSDEEGTL